ncbi:MAG: universal stress protein [Nocardioidaceae bacterium]
MIRRTGMGAVVVGVDGSTYSDSAVEWAVRYAQARHRPMLLCHAPGRLLPHESVGDKAAARARLRLRGRPVVDHALQVARRLDRDVEIESTVRLRDPDDALLELSEHASILVVGTRGRGPVTSMLLGSVSHGLIARSSCPVAVVRPADAREVTETEGHIVVGADGSEASSAALDFAFELASTEHRPLDMVHPWTSHDRLVDPSTYRKQLDLLDEHERGIAESASGLAEKYPDVVVNRHMPDRDPVPTFVDLSDTADTIVLGTRGRTGMRSVFGGSVSRSVVEQAHCTVVVVPPRG